MEPLSEEERQEVTVRRLGAGASELAVFDFQGELREMILSSLREGYLTTGSYVPGAKAVSPQGAMSLSVAGSAMGATAVSAAFSSTLYMATANPATLMTIGNGVGAAVMGTSGIVGQAPFIAVASSLPVVAPVLAIQALNTAVMMQQFKHVDRKLDSIKSTLGEAIARIEATHVGELFAASRVVDDVYRQYGLEGSFSNDMLIRLALAERDIGGLAVRSRHLVEGRGVATFDENTNFEQVKYDVHSAMLASLTQLRISYLRVCVDMQENPKSVTSSVEQLKSSIDEGIKFWQFLLNRSEELKNKMDERRKQLESMSWGKRNLPGREGSSVERELANLQAAYTSTVEGERALMSQYSVLIDSAGRTRSALESSQPSDSETSPTLVYWQDESGGHAFVTEKNLIGGAVAPGVCDSCGPTPEPRGSDTTKPTGSDPEQFHSGSVDVMFDFRSDTPPGHDPDSHSPTCEDPNGCYGANRFPAERFSSSASGGGTATCTTRLGASSSSFRATASPKD